MSPERADFKRSWQDILVRLQDLAAGAFFLGRCPKLEWFAPLGLTDQGKILRHLLVQLTSAILGQDLLLKGLWDGCDFLTVRTTD